MKILYLHQYFNTPQMNGSTRSYEFSRRLVQKGHEVHVIAASSSKDFHEVYDGINIHWLKVPYSNHMPFTKRMLAFIRFSITSFFKANSLSGDVIFATSTPLSIAIPGILLSKLKRVPFVFEVRDLWPTVPIAMGVVKNPVLIFLARALERIAYSSADRIIALSPGMKEGIVRVKKSSKNITVIPNSSDVGVFGNGTTLCELPYPFRIGKRVILYPGTVGYVNGCKYLVDLAERLGDKSNDIVVVIVGDGVERGELIEMAKQRNIYEKYIFFLDPVPKKDIPYIFGASEAVISTVIDLQELEANSANKFFDALAASKPVFINHGGWQADIINENRNGLVLSRDVKFASEQIVDFFLSGRAVANAGISSRMLADTKFNRDILFERFHEVVTAGRGE